MGGNTAYTILNSEQSDALFESRIDEKTSKLEVVENQSREWLTTDEAAAFLGISAASLRNLCSNGKIPYYKWQRRNRYKTDELRGLLLATRRGGSYGN